MGGRGTASGLTGGSAAPDQAAAPPVQQPTPQPAPQPQTSRLVSDTGVQDMDDAALTALIRRALRNQVTPDGRDGTYAQKIADALGISKNAPESVSQEALGQYRNGTYEGGTLYRTINGGNGKTARQIAHEFTSSTDSYGWNYGGGRVWGVGLYFAGTGKSGSRGAGAYESSLYGARGGISYTLEARLKPTARIATIQDITGSSGKAWAKARSSALSRIGVRVDASGNIHPSSGSRNDMLTTVAMLMGYDGFRNEDTRTPYFTIFNRGALQVARGNKYDRARNKTL